MSTNQQDLPLGFTQAWLEHKIIDRSWLTQAQRSFEDGEDPNEEHYRWKAFTEFLEQHKVIPETTLQALYSIGSKDADYSMGGAIMAEILQHNSCPKSLITEAMSSDRPHLRKIAGYRL